MDANEMKELAKELGVTHLDINKIVNINDQIDLFTPTQVSAMSQVTNTPSLDEGVRGALAFILTDLMVENIKLRKDFANITALLADTLDS